MNQRSGTSSSARAWKLYDYVIGALAGVAGVAIFAIFVFIVLDVAIRSVGLSPPRLTTAVVEYSLLYASTLGAPWVLRRKGHVFIDVVARILPPSLRRIVARLVYLVSIATLLVLTYFALLLLAETIATGAVDIRGIDVPRWMMIAPLPVCFIFLATEFARFLFGVDDLYGDTAPGGL